MLTVSLTPGDPQLLEATAQQGHHRTTAQHSRLLILFRPVCGLRAHGTSIHALRPGPDHTQEETRDRIRLRPRWASAMSKLSLRKEPAAHVVTDAHIEAGVQALVGLAQGATVTLAGAGPTGGAPGAGSGEPPSRKRKAHEAVACPQGNEGGIGPGAAGAAAGGDQQQQCRPARASAGNGGKPIQLDSDSDWDSRSDGSEDNKGKAASSTAVATACPYAMRDLYQLVGGCRQLILCCHRLGARALRQRQRFCSRWVQAHNKRGTGRVEMTALLSCPVTHR